MTPSPIETDGEVQVTGDAAAGTVTLAVSLPGIESGQFSLTMDCDAAEKLAVGLSLMSSKVKQSRLELAEKARKEKLLN